MRFGPSVPVPAFDRAVLVGHAAVVAGCDHAVMGGQSGEATCQILGLILAEITESGRETVGAVFEGDAAKRCQSAASPEASAV